MTRDYYFPALVTLFPALSGAVWFTAALCGPAEGQCFKALGGVTAKKPAAQVVAHAIDPEPEKAKQLGAEANAALDRGQRVLAFFWEPGCVPCARQDALLKQMQAGGRLAGVFVRKVNVHAEPDVAKAFGVTSEATPVLVAVSPRRTVARGADGYLTEEQVRFLLLVALANPPRIESENDVRGK